MEPQPNFTYYSITLAIITVLTILASPVASGLITPEVAAWCNLISVIVSALSAIFFTTKTNAGRNFLARFRTKK